MRQLYSRSLLMLKVLQAIFIAIQAGLSTVHIRVLTEIHAEIEATATYNSEYEDGGAEHPP
jgi:hypothetical protein